MGALIRNALRATFVIILATLTVPTGVGTAMQGPVSLLPDDPYQFEGPAGPQATVARVPVSGEDFSLAYRVTVEGQTDRMGDSAVEWITTRAVNPLDEIEMAFSIRSTGRLDGSSLRVSISFESRNGQLPPEFETIIPCRDTHWTPYRYRFKASRYYPAGESRFVLRFGYGPQEFEIGAIEAFNLGPVEPTQTFGIPLVPADAFTGYGAYFDGKVGGSLTIVNVGSQPFDKAFRISTNGISDFIYRSGLTYNNIQSVTKGDLCLLSFYARRIEPFDGGPIKAQVVFERNGGNYEKSLAINFPNDTDEWRLYQIPFYARTTFLAGEAHLIFHFGYGPQKFELGGISLLNYGSLTRPEQLPRSYYYPGRGDSQARWRIEADERIERHRKGDLTVIVRDRNGEPLTGARVRISQNSHAFRFGTAVTAQLLAGNGQTEADRKVYRSRVLSHFNTTVFENDLKWPFWEDWAPWNRQAVRDAFGWLEQNGLPVRGHNLIWPSYGHMPADTRSLTPDALRARIDGHFAAILSAAGIGARCYQWDVINEPFHNYEVQGRIPGTPGVEASVGLLGNQEMLRWFQNARAFDPAARLFLNDFDILTGGGIEKTHQDYLYSLLQWMIAGGAPIDGIGFQGHVHNFTSPEDIQSAIDRFAALGLQMAVTEFDIDTLDEELQAEYLRDFLTIVFSNPGFTDFLQWGFWEKAHWRPQAALYRQDWSSKPIAEAFIDQVYGKWWTDQTARTDENGMLKIRGFKGGYTITAGHLRSVTSKRISLDDAATVIIELDGEAQRPPLRRVR